MSAPPKASSKVPILCLGLPRTGSASLGKALERLGCKSVHHGTNMTARDPDWEGLSCAADRTFPTLPTYNAAEAPFTRSDWDAFFDDRYDAVTDVFSYFALSLLDAYPDAKVILVQRDFEPWLQSWKIQKQLWYSPTIYWLLLIITPLTGAKAFVAVRKVIMGWLGSNRRADIFDKAGEAYVRHYRDVREAMSRRRADLNLEFKLADGWEPLCKFLDTEVPEEPFPRVNDLKAHMQNAKKGRKAVLSSALRRVALVGTIGAVAAALYLSRDNLFGRVRLA